MTVQELKQNISNALEIFNVTNKSKVINIDLKCIDLSTTEYEDFEYQITFIIETK